MKACLKSFLRRMVVLPACDWAVVVVVALSGLSWSSGSRFCISIPSSDSVCVAGGSARDIPASSASRSCAGAVVVVFEVFVGSSVAFL